MMLTKYKLIAAGVALLVLLALSAAGGATVATWKANAAHAERAKELTDEIRRMERETSDLRMSIAEANAAVELMKAQTDAADQAKAQAEKHAETMASFSKSRMDKLERTINDTKSTTEDILQHFWELRQ